MNTIYKISDFLNKFLSWIAGIFLIFMILITCGNIFFRMTWFPIRGTFELMGYSGAILAAFALGYTQIQKGHIAVDILIDKFSPKIKRIINIINYLVCFIFFVLAAWQLAEKATVLKKTGEVTETLQIIYYPFVYAVGFGCLILSLAIFTDIIKSIFPAKES
jgi:TRAP-type C4-dicarboxylate transport system permease small subunit